MDASLPDPHRKDAEHLRLLAVFHFVLGGLAFVLIGFLALHFAIMTTVFSQPEIWRQASSGDEFPVAAFVGIFIWVYGVIGITVLVGAVLNLLSGFFILRRRFRTFSLVVAGLDCLQIPFGTVLGVFTLIVLVRPSVASLYADGSNPLAVSAP